MMILVSFALLRRHADLHKIAELDDLTKSLLGILQRLGVVSFAQQARILVQLGYIHWSHLFEYTIVLSTHANKLWIVALPQKLKLLTGTYSRNGKTTLHLTNLLDRSLISRKVNYVNGREGNRFR